MAKVACPNCGGSIVVGDRNYRCEKYQYRGEVEGCNFILWKDDLSKFDKENLTEAEVKKLLAGEQIPLKLKSPKSGKSFECKGKLESKNCNDGKTRWEVRMQFEPREEKVLSSDDNGSDTGNGNGDEEIPF